ncbi:MAG: PAS domain S-box protein [Campylobacterota bacterium]|nr:PAS domain S-box protein [Campylobacterota bacterium]
MAKTTTQQDIRSLDIDKKLLSSIDNGIIILDDELKIFYYNKWLELHTGIKESDAISKTLDQLFTGISSKTLKRKIKTALRLGTPTFYTANTSKYFIPIKIDQIKILNYSYMQQDVSIIPFDEDKKLVAIIITDQTNMANTNALLEENIKEVKKLNCELIKERDTIDKKVYLIKIDNDFLIRDISQAYLKLIGYTKDELIGNDFFHYERLHIKGSLKEKIILHLKEKKVLEFEEKTLSRDGKEYWMKNTLVPEYDYAANHIGFIIFRENTTDAKELHIHQDKLLVNSRSSAMGEMISMIAHQWRQPLSVINTIISTLRIKKELNILDEETELEAYTKIEDTVQYLSVTIDDFRNFFKKNKILTKVSLSSILDKSTSLLKGEMKLHEIEYIQRVDENLEIETFQNELVQAIINFIKNSIDAFEDRVDKNKRIIVDVEASDTHITITINDNAGGIDKKVINKIFEPYFSTKSNNGTGLGLYMSKTIVEKHIKGQLTVISDNGETNVIMELPYKIYNMKEQNESNLPPLPKCK